MATLYELADEYMQLIEMAGDPDMDPDVISDTMEAIEGALEDKADNYAKVLRELEATASALKSEEARIKTRRTAVENMSTRIKETLEKAMRTTGKVKFKTTLFSFGIQKNPPKVVIDDPEWVPEEYLIAQAPKIDTAAVKELLKKEGSLPWAHMEQGEGLRIR